MEASIRLGRILGIPLGINYSWFLIFLLITFSLASEFQSLYPLWSPSEKWGIALMTSILFFSSLLVHELSHSLVAIRRGIPVKGITLFVFGGVSQITREASRPATEFIMAVVGPLSSIVLGLLFWGLALLLRPVSLHAAAMAQLLFRINIVLGVFNMLPGFPLDGGRMLRAFIWWVWGSYSGATRIAVYCGYGVASLLMLAGVFIAFQGPYVQGIWLALIGWFLAMAAAASYRESRLRDVLRGYKAEAIMNPYCPLVSPYATVKAILQQYQGRARQLLPVVDGEKLVGAVSWKGLKKVPKREREFTPIYATMTPLFRLKTVTPETGALEALEFREEQRISDILVAQGDRLLGLIGQEELIKWVKERRKRGA